MNRVIVSDVLQKALAELNDDTYTKKLELIIDRLYDCRQYVTTAEDVDLELKVELATKCLTEVLTDLKDVYEHIGGDATIWDTEILVDSLNVKQGDIN